MIYDIEKYLHAMKCFHEAMTGALIILSNEYSLSRVEREAK